MASEAHRSPGCSLLSFRCGWSFPVAAVKNMTFVDQMRRLEGEFSRLAKAEGTIYLPNSTPSSPVDVVLIGMEPSLGWWARTPDEANRKVEEGFRNFMYSIEDFILHFCVRQYLCGPDDAYHVTDVSKGAMRVDAAKADRDVRYQRWYDLLIEEVDLVSKPTVTIVAIGQAVRKQLETSGFARPFSTILHYSAQAIRGRKLAVAGKEEVFASFAESISLDKIVAIAMDVVRENRVPEPIARETVSRLRRTALTESRKQLAFVYANAFKELKAYRGRASPLGGSA
jgi:hypothetical protein